LRLPEDGVTPSTGFASDGFDIKLKVVLVLCRIKARQEFGHGDSMPLSIRQGKGSAP
jgi:hypothetical protein